MGKVGRKPGCRLETYQKQLQTEGKMNRKLLCFNEYLGNFVKEADESIGTNFIFRLPEGESTLILAGTNNKNNGYSSRVYYFKPSPEERGYRAATSYSAYDLFTGVQNRVIIPNDEQIKQKFLELVDSSPVRAGGAE